MTELNVTELQKTLGHVRQELREKVLLDLERAAGSESTEHLKGRAQMRLHANVMDALAAVTLAINDLQIYTWERPVGKVHGGY